MKKVNYSKANKEGNNVYVAIAMALFQFEDENIHDKESGVLTVKGMKRYYSPWESKVLTLRHAPKR